MVEFLSVSSHGRGAKGAAGGASAAPTGPAPSSSSSAPPVTPSPGGGAAAAARRGASLTRAFRGSSAGGGAAAAASSPSSPAASSSSGRLRSLSRPRPRRDPWHDEIKAFEAARRARVGSLIDAIALSASAHGDLLEDGSLETSRAHRLVLGIARVHELMGASGAAGAGYLVPSDDPAHQEGKSAPLASSSCSFLLSLEQSEEIVSESFVSSGDQLHAVDLKLLKAAAEIREARAELESRASRVVSALRAAEDRAVSAWDAYQEAVQASRGEQKTAGGGVFSEFFSSSGGGGGGGSAHGGKAPPPARSRSESPEGGGNDGAGGDAAAANAGGSPIQDDAGGGGGAAASSSPAKVDPWLAELGYRQVLLSQKAAMDSCLKELEEVFGQVTGYECRRRINLREYMILACTSTKWVFTGAEAAQAAAVRDWIEKDPSADAIQKQVSESVRERLEALLDSSAAEDGAAGAGEGGDGDDKGNEVGEPPEGTGSDPVSVAMFYAGLFPAASPLQSEFLACAVVVERVFPNSTSSRSPRSSRGGTGGTGGGGAWDNAGDGESSGKYLALAVVTIDQMLHLFDLKEDSGVALDDPPERALDAFLKEAGGSASASGPGSIEPTRTVDLSLMRAALGGGNAQGDNVVELSPDPDTKAFSSPNSSAQSSAPLSLRTFSAREQAQLINAIHGDSIQAMF